MALLTVKERKELFHEIGLEYNKGGIETLQRKYMLRKSDYDGIYGPNTENLLLTVVYTMRYTKNFKPEEFRCDCGGRYCCGFPSYMKPHELMTLQAVRDYYGRPVKVTCGLRDRVYNSKLSGSVKYSKHLVGAAADIYIKGVTDSLSGRKMMMKWLKKQPYVDYAYGNGINSNGYKVNAPYMGSAVHIQTK